MFNIGDCVMYGTSGLCKIIDIRKENFGGKPEEYYILELVFDQSTVIYAPLENNKTPMRNVMLLLMKMRSTVLSIPFRKLKTCGWRMIRTEMTGLKRY